MPARFALRFNLIAVLHNLELKIIHWSTFARGPMYSWGVITPLPLMTQHCAKVGAYFIPQNPLHSSS